MKSFYWKGLAAAILIASASTASAGTYDFSYTSEEAEIYLIGFQLADHYDVGVYIPGNGLTDANAQLTEFSIMVPVYDNIKNFKMWVSTKLEDPGIARKFSGNVTNKSVSVVPADENANYGTITYKLANPYTITSSGVYIGYSFDVTEIDNNNNMTKYPLIVTEEGNDYSLIARTSNNYFTFEAMAPFALCCTATFEGDFYSDAVGVRSDKLYIEAGKSGELSATLVNLGTNGVSNIEYQYNVGDFTGNGSMKVKMDALTGSEAEVKFPIEAIEKSGVYEGTITITKVNGNDNSSENPTCNFKGYVLEKMPTHRPVMEEYTGTWCGWCPRGMAGMQLCKDKIDGFIGIAYHGRDIMALSNKVVPFNNSGYPMCFIDRQDERDPYYGLAMQPAHIRQEYNEAKEQFAPADVNVSAEWNEDRNALTLSSDVNFALIPDDGYDYRINYIVIENGLTGDDKDWYQLNNFSGDGSYATDRYLRIYANMDAQITDMVYNDVAVYSASILGIEESLPAYSELVANKNYSHSHTVALDDFLTANGNQSYQNTENMEVIALLIRQDGTYGTIVNAAKADVPSPTAVEEFSADDVISVEYYDLTGRSIANPENGIFIKVEKMTNGKAKVTKIIK